jgi:hypothetical protein
VIIDSIYPTVATDDFARRFSQRGGNLMWLLGAGASASRCHTLCSSGMVKLAQEKVVSLMTTAHGEATLR